MDGAPGAPTATRGLHFHAMRGSSGSAAPSVGAPAVGCPPASAPPRLGAPTAVCWAARARRPRGLCSHGCATDLLAPAPQQAAEALAGVGSLVGLCGHDHRPRRLAPHQVVRPAHQHRLRRAHFARSALRSQGMGRRRVPIRRELAAGRGCMARYRRGNRPCGYDRHCRGGGRRGTSSGRGGTSSRRCRQQRSRSLIVGRVGRRTCTANEAVVGWPACTRARQGQSRQEQQQGQCGQPDRTRHGAGRARRW